VFPSASVSRLRQQKRFREGRVRDVIREIRRQALGGAIRGKQKRHKARKIADYIQTNRDRMRYDRYRRMGLPIGSAGRVKVPYGLHEVVHGARAAKATRHP
jgi:hypothetical protein